MNSTDAKPAQKMKGAMLTPFSSAAAPSIMTNSETEPTMGHLLPCGM